MMRKIAISLVAAAIATAVSTLSASAIPDGGGAYVDVVRFGGAASAGAASVVDLATAVSGSTAASGSAAVNLVTAASGSDVNLAVAASGSMAVGSN